MKRFTDIVLSLVALIVGLVPFVVVWFLVRVNLGKPVIFEQSRPGLNGRPFKLFKFRSMSAARGADGELLSDEERLGRFGSFLRSTSLDELPEIWNVLRGEMSWVGPRPLLMEYLPLYSSSQMRRHEVRPGITGWAQISGRNSLSWEEKFDMDVWYVDNRSQWLDLKILVITIGKMITGKDINAPQSATMFRFGGNVSAKE